MIKPHATSDFWDFGDHRENPIHRIHSYPAKFPAFITTKALRYAEKKGVSVNTIGDLCCGCGTTAVEAKKIAKNYWGCDINPVATLIAKVKTSQYRDATLEKYFLAVMKRFDLLVIDENEIHSVNDRIKYWHDDESIKNLLKLKKAITQEIPGQSKYLKFFLCAFSNILKPTSKWLTKSIKPQIDPEKIPCDVREAFKKQFALMRKASEQNTFPDSKGVSVRIDNTNYLTTRKNELVDLVVTSPPYVSSYDYADVHQLSILWLDFASDYRSLRKNMIGNQYGMEPPLKSEVNNLCDTARFTYKSLLKTDRRKAYVVIRYFIDMEKMVARCWKLLSPNGMAIFVIGNTKYKGVTIDNSRYLTECMERSNFCEIETMQRKISLKIMTPYRDSAGRFTKDSGERKVYNSEFVVAGKKNES